MPNSFTPDEISQILEEFFKAVGTRQYIGARYVPIFGRTGETSIQWDNDAPYEPLTIVLYQGNSYTSRQYVPEGVEITNEAFWALTGNYNAQVEAYRQEVQGFSARIDAIETSDTAQNDQLAGSAPSGLKTLIDANTSHLADIDEQLAGETDSGLRGLIGTNAAAIAENTASIETLDDTVTANATAAQLEFDGLHSDIDGINASLSQVDSKFSAIAPRLLGPIGAYKDTICVIFGDSFTDSRVAYSEYGQWPNAIASAFGFDVRNYAVSGSGIVHGNANLVTELSRAVSEMTADERANTSLIIMYYGYNDLSQGVAASRIVDNFRSFVTSASANFPNARILAIPFNYGSAQLSMARETLIGSVIQSMRDVANGYHVEIVDNARFWLLGQFDLFKDSVHPNATGFKQIASYITNAILGNSMQVHRSGTVELEAGAEAYKACHWVQQDGIVTLYARFVPTTATSSPTTEVLISPENMPPILCPELLMQSPVNGAGATGLFTLSNQLRAYQYTVPTASTALLYEATFRAAANKAWS